MSKNSEANNVVQQMAEKIMPGLQTDHGGINLGDVVVLIMSSVLLIYTGYRSWHFISLSIPQDFQILALVGLWGIDIGMVGWAVTWIFGSSSPGQDGVSLTMWVIDVIAMVLTSVIDTIMYADGSAIPEIVKTIAWYGIPMIIVGNAVMAIIYHFTSPATKYRRKQRKLEAEIEDARQRGVFDIRKMTETANMLQSYTKDRTNALLLIASVSDQNVQLVDLEQQIVKRLNRAGLQHLTGSLGAEIRSPNEEEPEDLNDKISRIRESLRKQRSEYALPGALPCGHTQGTRTDKNGYLACKVCGQLYDGELRLPDLKVTVPVRVSGNNGRHANDLEDAPGESPHPFPPALG